MQDMRDTEFQATEIYAIHNKLTINDDPWELSEKRELEFINLELKKTLTDAVFKYDFIESNIMSKELIKTYLV